MEIVENDNVCKKSDNGQNNNINNIIKMTIAYLYAYTLLLIITIFYPGMIGSKQGLCRKSYIPKSKRGMAHKIGMKLQESLTMIYNKIVSMEINTDNRKPMKPSKGNYDGCPMPREKGLRTKLRHIMASAVIAMTVGHDRWKNRKQRKIIFDSDTESIGIDNRCSACMSHKIDDFVGTPKESKRTIKGFGGTRISNVMTGTIKWRWLDDNGGIHEFKIPNSYYVPDGGVRLMSPQHWAQSQRNQFGKRMNYGCDTKHDKMILYWDKESQHKLTIPISEVNNVATFDLAPGFNKFKLFCEEAQIDYEKELSSPATICMSVEMDNEDEHERMSSENAVTIKWPELKVPINESIGTGFSMKGKAGRELPIPKDRISDNQIKQSTTESELLEIHQRYGHVSFHKLVEMAKQGIINSKFQRCRIPVCSTCMFAKATRKRWRDKPITGYTTRRPNQPGEKVSVDQLVSPTPGLVAQMTGRLTTKRYRYATVYVDQATGYGYVHLQKTATAEETIQGKLVFEDMALRHGINIKSYHADNGIFKARKWVEACRLKQQSLTFAGVNAHHQNGIAERRIRTLQEMARAMMIHAHRRWPEAITPNLWPYAIKLANESLNETPNMIDKNKRSPVQSFSNSNVQHNPKHAKTFGSPVYVLDNSLQKGSHLHKWSHRSRVGIYLGRSPQHSRNVALVLDRITGLVSPQFHVSHDNNFDTVAQEKYESKWQLKAGFTTILSKRGVNLNDNQREVNKKRIIDRLPDGKIQAYVTPAKSSPNEDRAKRLERRNAQKQLASKADPEGDEIMESSSSIEKVDGVAMQTIDEVYGCKDRDLYEERDPLYAYKAVTDPDTMYLHQALREKDRDQFIEAMKREVDDQSKNGNFTIIRRKEMPEGKRTLKSVWQMRRKRDIKTRQIKKYKARLNIDGSRMVHGIDYDETYAPVASWRTIRLILTMALVNKWHTRQLDYVLAFPQAPVERDLYMDIPKGLDIEGKRSEDYVLKINRNIYGQKQAGRVWNQYLVNKLVNELGFVQSKIDECLFYRGEVMYALYTDDSILAGPSKPEIDKIIKEMRTHKLNITDEGDITDFLGVNIENRGDGTVKLSQPHLVDQILKDLRLESDDVKTKSTPAASSKILSRHPESPPFDDSFHFRSVIGKLNYLEKCTRPDIAYAAHQCARFTEDPRQEHGKAVRWLGRYLKGTRDKGIIFRPLIKGDLEVYVDADFVGNWKKEESNDRDNARSRHGYVIRYHGCPILWKSQLQGEIALSSTESEYMGISYSLRDAIPIMETLDEMKEKKFPITNSNGKVKCSLFEDNSGALEMAKVHKYRPRTKHINAKYHHFRDFVTNGRITLHPIETESQPADMLTKPLNETALVRHRTYIMGW